MPLDVQSYHAEGSMEDELRRAKEKIAELRSELDDAHNLVSEMREWVEDHQNVTDNWIDVCDMHIGDDGVYQFNPNQTALWERHANLLESYKKLIQQWNRFVRKYNTTVAPLDIGRPLAASAAQQAEIRKRRKAGFSLRAIARAMSLSLRTVRTVVEKDAGKDRTAKHKKELRRMEFDRQRAIAFRARMARRKQLEKDITALDRQATKLIKAAKGLDR